MRCPQDGEGLVTEQRHAVTVDRCPRCAGVWLDPAAVAAILDRVTAAGAPATARVGTDPAAGHAAGHVSGEGGQGAGPDPGLGRDATPAPGPAGWLAEVLRPG